MSLLRGDERLLHTDVQLLSAGLEPYAPTSPQPLRLLDLGQSQKLTEEPPSFCFAPARSGHLNVVKALNKHLINLQQQTHFFAQREARGGR